MTPQQVQSRLKEILGEIEHHKKIVKSYENRLNELRYKQCKHQIILEGVDVFTKQFKCQDCGRVEKYLEGFLDSIKGITT